MSDWANRITGSGEVDPRVLAANAKNWRVHTSRQKRSMKVVLDGIGFVQGVLVNERTGTIIDGHMRVEMAIARGEETVPVDYVDMDDAEESLVLATLDPIRTLAERDTELYGALREENAARYRGMLALLDGDRAGDDEEELPPSDRDDMTMDHTAIFMQDEETDAAGEGDDVYGNLTVRQIQFIFDVETYDDVLDVFDDVMEHQTKPDGGLIDTNADALFWLLTSYGGVG